MLCCLHLVAERGQYYDNAEVPMLAGCLTCLHFLDMCAQQLCGNAAEGEDHPTAGGA